MIESLRARLAAPKDAAALAFFRVAFGVMMAISAFRFLYYGWIDELIVRPTFHFTYWGLSFVKPLGAFGMKGVFVALLVLGLTIAAGLFYRASMALFLLLFTYVNAIDVTNYLNHYYLIVLLSLLMLTMPLGSAYSVDAWRNPAKSRTTFPAWCTYLLRFQIATVYFYAGLAKLSSDWLLHAEPLNIWLNANAGLPILGRWFALRETAIAFSWAGFLFDTTVWVFLLARRTRPYAYVVVIAFHAMTQVLFPIGMFPTIMVVSALAFFDSSWPRKFAQRFARRPHTIEPAPSTIAPKPFSRVGTALLVGYAVLQVLLPLRHYAYDGNVLWHEQGMRFSWKVMCREKSGNVTYFVTSKDTRRTWEVSPDKYLTARQLDDFPTQPDLVLALAHHIQKVEETRLGVPVEVRAEAHVSLNGRKPALLIDPSVDLTKIDDGIAQASWISKEPSSRPLHLASAYRR